MQHLWISPQMLQTKNLRPGLRPLDATLTKNRGGRTLLSTRKPAKPRLGYTLLSGGTLARSRQKCPADSQRAVSHRESGWRQPRLSRFDARVSRFYTQDSRPPGRNEQLRPFDCFFSRRHAHSAFLWDFHSRRAGRWRPDRHFQWLDYAEKQRGSGPRPRGAEKSESHRCFSQRLLSSHSPANGWTRLHIHGHHAWRKRASPPGPERSCDPCCGDRFGARGDEHFSLLRFCRSTRCGHRRKRHGHHPAALFFSSCVHRRPDFVEWSEYPAKVCAHVTNQGRTSLVRVESQL